MERELIWNKWYERCIHEKSKKQGCTEDTILKMRVYLNLDNLGTFKCYIKMRGICLDKDQAAHISLIGDTTYR